MHPIIPLPSTASQDLEPAGPRKLVVTGDAKIIAAIIDRLVAHSRQRPADLAAQLGIQRQSLGQYIIGRRSNPSAGWLARLAEVCHARLVIELID